MKHIFTSPSKTLLYTIHTFVLLSLVQPFDSIAQQTSNDRWPSSTVAIDLDAYRSILSTAPKESTTHVSSSTVNFNLPMPDGSMQNYEVVESSILSADFAAQYPNFKTYSIQATDRPEVSGRLSVTPYGLNAVILAPEGFIHLTALDLHNPILHRVSLVNLAEDIIECHAIQTVEATLDQNTSRTTMAANGATKRTYTLAVVCTGEFHDANGGTIAAARAVAMNSVNSIQAIFERELSVGFALLTPFIYTDAANDPFNPGLDMVQEAAQAVEANFSGQGYDIGHVFHDSDQGAGNLGGGGVAGLGVVCSNDALGTGFRKAGGWSGSFDNVSPGWIKLATHEFGHMFNMTHTFNGDGSNCTTGNHPTSTAYEIGSGTTIMSYQGICDANYNIPSAGVADHYFHANSLDRAVTYMAGQNCHAATATGNSPPVATADICNAGPYNIPISTPFRLTGSATDADGDQIYYAWEQYDEDGANTAPTHGFIGVQAAGSTIAPLFRSYPPTTSPSRTFPNMNLVRTNQYASSFEPLPTVARTLNFRLTTRDWKAGGGGIDCKPLAVTVNASGPLAVSAPNGGENLTAGNATNVTWSNNTAALSATVNIKLSIDGGITFPYTLAAGTANDGLENVTIPAGVSNTTTARMMVESAANTCVVFFDISNADFTINSNCQAATSNVCPTTPVNLAAGNGGLNLNMSQYFGAAITQTNFAIANGNPSGPLANATVPGGQTCQTAWGTERYAEFDFAVSTAGAYTLSTNATFFEALSVFVANGYNPANPCAGTFLGSTTSGAISSTGTMTINLNPCTVYKAVVWTTNNNLGTGSINFTGVGSIFGSGNGPGGNYGYTYAAVNTANGQVAAVSAAADFTALAGGSYQVYGTSYYSGGGPTPPTVNPANWVGQTISQILSGGSCALFSTNSRPVTVTGGGGCTNPTVNAPTLTQPTCQTPTGTIVINANGTSTLEYSVNDGATYQASNTFAGLNPGAYNIRVRLQNNPTCFTSYAQNPVALNTPMGCGGGNCMDYVATGLPLNIQDNQTVNSTINVPNPGTITDVKIKNLVGTHTFIQDLTFTLMSPQGTSVILIANACDGSDNFNVTLDDASGTALQCPYNAGNTDRPQNPLSAFDGQNQMGNWVLMVNDNQGGDQGQLTGWTLEICVQAANPPGYTCATAIDINAAGTYTAPGPSQGNGAVATDIATHANWYRFTPPMTGMIRIFTCGLNNGGNNHNHIYLDATNCPTNVNNVVHTADRGCAGNPNDPAAGVLLENVPVTMGTPIYIEWDDALGNTAAFDWTLEYMGGAGNCTDYVATGLPLNIQDNQTVNSTINVPNAGTITDVKIKNLVGTHSYIQDLTFTLMSPQNTSVVLIANACGDDDNFNLTLDDASLTALQCPYNAGNTDRPQNPLSAFDGQNQMGNWVLMINDNQGGDEGQLTGWTLEICTSGGGNCPPTRMVNDSPIANGTYQAGTQLTSTGTVGVGNNVIFQAGNNVELQNNFTVPQTSIFEVRIAGCQ